MCRRLITMLIIAIGLGSTVTPVSASPECPDSELFSGKLITDICWDCMFPMYISGIQIISGNDGPPPDAYTKSYCYCDDANGVPVPGAPLSYWEPNRLIELVRYPGCSTVLGGLQLPLSDERMLGGEGSGDNDTGDVGFYHYHMYSFPLLIMLDMLIDGECNPDGFMDLDLAYMSELDPTWNNDELAFFTNAEAAAFANPLAISACMADAASAAAGKPIDSLFWCAGNWGAMYPLSGYQGSYGSMPENTSMLATRAIAAQHRRGLMRRTMGEDSYCYAEFEPFIIKSMYKMTMFFPLPEAEEAHVIGQNTFTWGEDHTIPGVGEDAVYVIWRWLDCCSLF